MIDRISPPMIWVKISVIAGSGQPRAMVWGAGCDIFAHFPGLLYWPVFSRLKRPVCQKLQIPVEFP
jgi:hypothetical protein